MFWNSVYSHFFHIKSMSSCEYFITRVIGSKACLEFGVTRKELFFMQANAAFMVHMMKLCCSDFNLFCVFFFLFFQRCSSTLFFKGEVAENGCTRVRFVCGGVYSDCASCA